MYDGIAACIIGVVLALGVAWIGWVTWRMRQYIAKMGDLECITTSHHKWIHRLENPKPAKQPLREPHHCRDNGCRWNNQMPDGICKAPGIWEMFGHSCLPNHPAKSCWLCGHRKHTFGGWRFCCRQEIYERALLAEPCEHWMKKEGLDD